MVTLDELAGGDVSKYEYFENMHVIKFLNLLTYKIEKAEEEKRQIELAKLRAKL